MLRVVIIIIIIVALSLGWYMYNNNMMEGFYGDSGQFCITCSGKTINQALQCFNCGWCEDRFGNGKAIGGDLYGPFNLEDCATWTHGDPYSKMIQRNANYTCAMGPRNVNRII